MNKSHKAYCAHCGGLAKRVRGAKIYPHRPDLHKKFFYECEPCGAYVGCHGSGKRSLGTCANAELRALRGKTHAAFDAMWTSWASADVTPNQARTLGYQWLADTIACSLDVAHIGNFNAVLCEFVIRKSKEQQFYEPIAP